MPGATAPKIMLIRHGEKPHESFKGVTHLGDHNKHSLIVPGWARAGALAVLFRPFDGHFQHESLATPHHLYATRPDSEGHSRRELELFYPLSVLLSLRINNEYDNSEAQCRAMADAAMAHDAPVLICWHHGTIPHVANHFLKGSKATCPQVWDSARFDMVWVFDLQPDRTYSFTQVPQNLMIGDLNTPIG